MTFDEWFEDAEAAKYGDVKWAMRAGWNAALEQGEPVAKNQCGETCDRASLCWACGLALNGREAAVARVRVHTTGGNAGLAWSAVPTDDAPHMRDGDLLYAAPAEASPLDINNTKPIGPDNW